MMQIKEPCVAALCPADCVGRSIPGDHAGDASDVSGACVGISDEALDVASAS